MEAIGFLCVSLGSSTVQFHDSLGSRRACTCSEASFSSPNGNRTWEVYYQRVAFCCVFFADIRTQCKGYHKEMFPLYGGKCLSCKAVHNWVKKFSQGRSKVVDDVWPDHPVEIATEATVQQVEELIWADRRIKIDSVATALGCSHGLAYSMIIWSFRK
jgi:hypothetical protein